MTCAHLNSHTKHTHLNMHTVERKEGREGAREGTEDREEAERERGWEEREEETGQEDRQIFHAKNCIGRQKGGHVHAGAYVRRMRMKATFPSSVSPERLPPLDPRPECILRCEEWC